MKKTLLITGLFISLFSFGEDFKPETEKDYLYRIEKVDISDLWTLTEFKESEEDTLIIYRQEPLGFIGDNYQRFQIHFISVMPNLENKLEYYVYGKTKVKGNVCDFQGTIRINEAKTYIGEEIPDITQGSISGNYEFFESPKQNGAGIVKGIFHSDFYLDKGNHIKYNALWIVADGYCNNQFEGTWASYKTGETKKCNWGDYRIPECEWQNGCDIGAAYFSINPRYRQNGWENYYRANDSDDNNPEVLKARKIEAEKWWIEK